MFQLLNDSEAHPWGPIPNEIFDEIGVIEPLHVLEDGNHDPPSYTAWAKAFSPDGSMIVTGNCDREAILWNVENGERIRTFSHPNPLIGEGQCPPVAFSPDGTSIAFGNIGGNHSDSQIIIWDVATGEILQSINDNSTLSMKFSPDGSMLVTSPFGVIRIWDVETGELVNEIDACCNIWPGVTISPDNTKVLIGGKPERNVHAKLVDIFTGETIQEYDSGPETHLGNVLFTPDGSKIVATGSQNMDLFIFDTESGVILNIIRSIDLGGHHNISISPDGKKVLTNRSIIYDLFTGEPLRIFGRGQFSWAWGETKYSPAGNHVATGEDVLQLWDISDLKSGETNNPTQSSVEDFLEHR